MNSMIDAYNYVRRYFRKPGRHRVHVLTAGPALRWSR